MRHAPEKYKFEEIVGTTNQYFGLHPLSVHQEEALRDLWRELKAIPWKGNEIHQLIHRVKEKYRMNPRDLFIPLYRMFLDRDDGPQIGWFLSTISRNKVRSQIARHLSSSTL
jgi:lysyl-tRNA synthetase class 1